MTLFQFLFISLSIYREEATADPCQQNNENSQIHIYKKIFKKYTRLFRNPEVILKGARASRAQVSNQHE